MEIEDKKSSWRPNREHIGGKPKEVIPATRFFDNLSYIGDSSIGCFVLETSDGLVMLDCRWPTPESVTLIEQGYRDLSLDLHSLKAILITHGHADHFGRADLFRERYGCKIYMPREDVETAKDPTQQMRMEFEADCYFEDCGLLTFGDTVIRTVHTPGHTVGSYSFIFPVFDEGRPHMAALWGGTGIFPFSPIELKLAYLSSLDKFGKLTTHYHVDVEIAAHPFVDNGVERLAVCRNIVNGVANPFVIGHEAYKRYEKAYYDMVMARM